MAQLQQSSSAALAVSLCTHAIPDSLAVKLPKPQICPTCIVEQYIRTIKDIQRQLVDRGGAFMSKETGRSHHKSIRRQWRDAKIALVNTITKFEELVVEKDVPPEDLGNIRDALNLWESRKIQLTTVPGVVYVAGAEETQPTEEDHEIARLTMELLKAVLKKEIPQEDWVEVTTETPAAGAQPQGEAPSSVQQSSVATPEIPTPPSTQSTRDVQHEATLKSILKRRASTSPISSSQRKRVRTAEFATICSERLSTSNPSPFSKLSAKATVQPHGPHTTADQHRHRYKFHRGTPEYVPGVWASKAFSEKADTSYFNTPVGVMKESVRRELEEAEKEKEKEMARRLKLVWGGWVAMFWVKNVVPHLDLEKLRDTTIGK